MKVLSSYYINLIPPTKVSMMSHDQTFITAKTEEVVFVPSIPNNKSEEIRETVIIERSEVEAQVPEVPAVNDAEAQQAKEGEESGFVTIDDAEKEI